MLDVEGFCTESSLDYCPTAYLCLTGFKMQDYCQTVWAEWLQHALWACRIWTVRLLACGALQGILPSLAPLLLVLPPISPGLSGTQGHQKSACPGPPGLQA